MTENLLGTEEATPNPRKTISNLRGHDYDLNSTVADLIDNSIDAKAGNVWVQVALDGSFISVLDDGKGMSEDTHREAMKLGSETRSYAVNDLSKYGTGMKAASLALGRSVTVITKADQASEPMVRRLDQDHIEATNDWGVATQVLSTASVPKSILESLMSTGHGTCVLIEKLERAFGTSNGRTAGTDRILSSLEELEAHLGLVFHRFLDGSFQDRKIAIHLNGTLVNAWDPYCLSVDLHSPTKVFEPTKISLGNERYIELQGFSLPRKDEFKSESDHRVAGGPKRWNDSQGFYVYRNGRLIRWGGWLKTRSNDEHRKLARIRLDFSAELDDLLAVNIAKSRVELPKALRDKLENYVSGVVREAESRYRGAKKLPTPRTPHRSGVSEIQRSYRAKDLAILIDDFYQSDPKALRELRRSIFTSAPKLAKEINWDRDNE